MSTFIPRYLEKYVIEDLNKKMVFIGGPRQCGKTTLSKHILDLNKLPESDWYLNWDAGADREQILKEEFRAGKGLLVLDEIHKYSRWRQILKGLYDKRKDDLKILVTGSARLDHYRRGGDSLQGRYHFYRMHPLSLVETAIPTQDTLESLMRYGGFPEPFFLQSERESRRWSREYHSRTIQEDLSDLENVKEIALVEKINLLLSERVGAPLSLNALRENLQVSHQSVSRWIIMLENLYLIFRIYPFTRSFSRSVTKEAKHYHLDWTVIKDDGARFENCIACHLLKWAHFQQDYEGKECNIQYFRDTSGREVDFVITEDDQPLCFVECKLSRKPSSKTLIYLKKRFPQTDALQISMQGHEDLVDKHGIRHCSATKFLSTLI